MAIKLFVGDAAIRREIKGLGKVLDNINDRIQSIAVSIITHAAGDGNGDMSRALDLCKVIAKKKSLNVAYVVGFFRYFASTTVNLKGNDGAGKVSLMSKDAKGYRGFDVAGAKANRWDEAFDDQGNRAAWYQGPAPAEFQPMTVGDLAQRMVQFVERTTKLLSDTKAVGGKDVPVVALTEQDRTQVEHAMAFINRIANTLARHEDVQRLEAQLAAANEDAAADEQVIEIINADRAVA